MKIKLLIIIGIFVGLIAGIPGNARALTDVTTGGDMQADIQPVYPGPNEQVNVTVSSLGTDLDRAQITWNLNGTEVKRGTGATEYVFTTGEAGKKITLVITAQTSTGTTITKTLTMVPASVDVLWEADSYTPPWYRGKALPPPNGTLRLVAMPTFVTENGTMLNPNDLTYIWKEGQMTLTQSSGVGKNSISIKGGGLLGNADVSLTVTNQDQTIRADKFVSVPSISPQIVFYEEHPLEGTRYSNGNLSVFNLQQQEMTIRAEPFFFSSSATDKNTLRYSWTVNGNAATPDADEPRLITLRQAAKGGAGSATLGLDVTNLDKLFQEARATVLILFGTNTQQ
jgi:hypothetical protein